MVTVIGVRFRTAGKIYYFSPGKRTPITVTITFYLLSVPGMLLLRFTPAVNLLFHDQKHQLHGQFHIHIRVQADTCFVYGL